MIQISVTKFINLKEDQKLLSFHSRTAIYTRTNKTFYCRNFPTHILTVNLQNRAKCGNAKLCGKLEMQQNNAV